MKKKNEYKPESIEKVEQPAAEEANNVNVEEEIIKLKDLLMRAMAEAENTRKRAEKEKLDAFKYATSSFARDLLSVSDNLRRALESLPEKVDPSMQVMIDGIKMTESELLNAFNKHGIKRITPVPGDVFNHEIHQAMFEIPTDEFKPGLIVQVMQAGFTLNDRLLRPAMVGVAKAK